MSTACTGKWKPWGRGTKKEVSGEYMSTEKV
jgi:hypothetical protein